MRLASLCAAEWAELIEAALPEPLNASVKKKKKDWGRSIARCVMQNNVIFPVHWNQEG